MTKMAILVSARTLSKYQHLYRSGRCLCTSHSNDPKDTIGPPIKAWKYVINKLNRLVEASERKLETNLPKVYKAYNTVKCVRFIILDTRTYFSVATNMWTGRELHTFSRRELEIYQEMPRDLVKVVLLLLAWAIPVVGNGFLIIGYWFPRVFFTHHLWNESQKQQFGCHKLAHRINHYHQVLQAMDHKAYKHTEGETRDALMAILDKRLLSKANGLSLRRSSLSQDALIALHIDRAMMKEGIVNLSDSDMCTACLKRGLNPYGLTRDDRMQFLLSWTSITQKLDETGVSLLLHSPALLTYNATSNIQLMKGKRYKWRRIAPI
ncbi:LETM1 domain-containing protein 1-like isoform X3 [Dreissena polymorpha]|uniref:LETM1 domain-containing protein 1-like isoform X3 n=1 Tax=Dreissena polymorpha TaxID=45954 RepID=UPI0022647177|nr:LETM1 domain-containing protein 1-like isoform X3 [Dreissena polymorpha]